MLGREIRSVFHPNLCSILNTDAKTLSWRCTLNVQCSAQAWVLNSILEKKIKKRHTCHEVWFHTLHLKWIKPWVINYVRSANSLCAIIREWMTHTDLQCDHEVTCILLTCELMLYNYNTLFRKRFLLRVLLIRFPNR